MKISYQSSLFSVLVSAALAASTSAVSAPPLMVTEVCPSNRGLVQDEDGDSPDWIELFNAGEAPVDLSRYALTDDPDQPRKWEFPGRVLPGGDFLLVFASGKDRRSVDALHANFKLRAKGEFLGLSEDGNVVQAVEAELGRAETDGSYGVVFRGGEAQPGKTGLLAEATPGAPNVETWAEPITADTKFSMDRGFYREPFTVTVSCETPGAEIRYTLDGGEPSPSHGLSYEGPVEITTTTTLRAVAMTGGHRPSDVDTHTYIFPEAVVRQPRLPEGWPRTRPASGGRRGGGLFGFGGGGSVPMDYEMADPRSIGASDEEVIEALQAIPSFSIVTELANLLDPDSGIYANPAQRGRDWERPVSIELIDPTGAESGFHWNAGLRIRGGHSRQAYCAKHAFRVYFRDEYGDGTLRYPLFGSEGVNEFEDIDLRTAQNYSFHFSDDGAQNTMIREVFARDTQRDLGRPYARSRYYHLYLNGLYWGLYQTQEHTEASYAERYFGGDKERYDVMKARVQGQGMGPTDGTREAWDHLYETANAIAAEPDPARRLVQYRDLQGLDAESHSDSTKTVYLDADNLIDYMLVIFFTGSFDGPVSQFMRDQGTNNWFAVFQREGRLGFQFFCHDTEHSLGSKWGEANNRVGPFPAGDRRSTSNPQWIHQQLLAVEAYRNAFQERAEWALLDREGPLTLKASVERVNRRAEVVTKAIVAECARWGDYKMRPGYSKASWEAAVQRVRDVLEIRAGILPDQLRQAQRFVGGTPRQGLTPAPLFSTVPVPVVRWTDAGRRAGQFVMDANEGAVRYTTDGTDPRASASAREADPVALVEVPLLRPGRMIRAFVPRDNSLRGAWREVDFDDRQWRAGIGGAGYDLREDYRKLIGVDLREEMAGQFPAMLTRSFFKWDGEPLDQLVLKLRFEDGFVAYLNGREVASFNAPRDRRELVFATAGHEDAMALAWKSFDLSEHRSLLRPGENVLALHVFNDQLNSSDLVVYPQLAGFRRVGGTEFMLEDGVDDLRARALVGGEWGPMRVVPVMSSGEESAVEPVPAKDGNVVISEIMYHPADPSDEEASDVSEEPEDYEFLELTNIAEGPVDLSRASFSDGITLEFTEGTILNKGESAVVVKHRGAFVKRYGDRARILGLYEGSLKNSGEKLSLEDATGETIGELSYKDEAPWPQSADGMGFSLVLKDPKSNPSLNLASQWDASRQIGGSPGSADVAPPVGGVVVNEILTHTDLPDVDAIELHNPTAEAIDVSGWYLTDDRREPKKYRLVAGSKIPAGGYLVIKGDTDDNPENNASLPADRFAKDFSLSSHGEEILLSSADAEGNLTGYSHGFDFIAGENGISFGRHLNSEGEEQFPRQSRVTLGRANSEPRTPLVVISEIMYHPDESDVDEEGEFIEIWNWSRQAVPFFDPLNPANTWQISGVDFTFPRDQTLKPDEVAVICRMDPETFRRRHRIPATVKVYGPLGDVKIDNGGERLRLLRPDLPDLEAGENIVPMLEVDSVRYNDREPWQEEADGGGFSIERVATEDYSDDPKAWTASARDGGTPGFKPGDGQ